MQTGDRRDAHPSPRLKFRMYVGFKFDDTFIRQPLPPQPFLFEDALRFVQKEGDLLLVLCLRLASAFQDVTMLCVCSWQAKCVA